MTAVPPSLSYDLCPVLGLGENLEGSAIGNGLGEGNQEGLPGGGETYTISRQEEEQEDGGGVFGERKEYRKKTPRPETTWHHQKTLSSVGSLGREVRLGCWAKARE